MKINVKPIAKSIKKAFVNNKSAIFTYGGLTSMIVGSGLMVKSTIKSVKEVEKIKEEQNVVSLTPAETAKAVWKNYVPPVVAIGVGAVGVVSGKKIDGKNIKELTGIAMSANAVTTAINKVIDEKGDDDIKEAVKQETQKALANVNRTQILTDEELTARQKAEFEAMENSGLIKVKCMWTGREIITTKSKKDTLAAKLKETLFNNNYASLNDMYSHLGSWDTQYGSENGWNIDRDGLVDVDWIYTQDEAGGVCWGFVFDYPPHPDFDRYM